jgi:hypothetical protein
MLAFFFNDLKCSNCLPCTSTHCLNLSVTCRYGIPLVSPDDKIIACTAFPLLNISVSSNHFFKTPTKCTLCILHIFFTKPLLHVSVCYTPSSGRNAYTGSKVSPFYKVGWTTEEVVSTYMRMHWMENFTIRVSYNFCATPCKNSTLPVVIDSCKNWVSRSVGRT